MRIAASLGSLILLLNITAAAVAADDPLMKQAQGLFQPIPSIAVGGNSAGFSFSSRACPKPTISAATRAIRLV